MHMRTPALLLLAGSFAIALASGCTEAEPAEAVVLNRLSANAPVTIEKVWFRTTLFARPIAMGETSESLRVGTGTEHAYAVVRVGEDEPDGGARARRFVARTKDLISSEAETKLTIELSTATAQSLCFGEPRLTRDEWDFITSRIFPHDRVVEFDDPNACALKP
jgi:hypothetical protein